MTRRPAARPRPDGPRRRLDGDARGRLASLSLLLLPLLACAPSDRQAVPGGPGEAGADHPLTASERAGEEIYRRENCARCHTQFDAPPPAGPIALPGPSDIGPPGSRVGPDLGLEGHRRSDDWQYAHLYAPDIVVPGSNMPASRHLFGFGASGVLEPAQDALHLVAYLQSLGRSRRDVWEEFRSREPPIPVAAATPGIDRLERGKRLYAGHCASCHGVLGDGRGPAAGLLLFPPRDFTAGHYRFRSGPARETPRDADLFRTITLGTGTGSAMPAFYFLPAEDRWALVLRLKEFSPALRGDGLGAAAAGGGPPLAGPVARAPMATEGRELWSRLECAACHGPEGKGLTREEAGARWADPDGVSVPRSGDLTHACGRRGGGSDVAFARALLYGVGSPMPAFADDLDQPLGAARVLLHHLEAKRRPSPPP